MAYDPNDPADKKIVAKLIKDAVDAREAELAEEHENDIEGLKKKNTELLGKLKKARNGEGEDSAAEVERLEGELAQSRKDLAAAQKAVRKAEGERDNFKTQAETEGKYSSDLLIDNGLTAALTEHKIAPQFMPAAKALLSGKATIKTEGDKRSVVVGDKALGDFVKEWAISDAGKHYVTAPANGGGNAPGSQAPAQSGKTMLRSQWDAADQSARSAFIKDGGKVIDG